MTLPTKIVENLVETAVVDKVEDKPVTAQEVLLDVIEAAVPVLGVIDAVVTVAKHIDKAVEAEKKA